MSSTTSPSVIMRRPFQLCFPIILQTSSTQTGTGIPDQPTPGLREAPVLKNQVGVNPRACASRDDDLKGGAARRLLSRVQTEEKSGRERTEKEKTLPDPEIRERQSFEH